MPHHRDRARAVQGPHERKASDRDRPRSTGLACSDVRKFALIGAPALGLALTATTLDAYVPVLARDLTSSRLLIG